MNFCFFKRAAALLTASAVVFALSGCGKNESQSGKGAVSIEIWHYYNGSLQNSFDKMVERFNSTVGAENGITVTAHSRGSISELEAAIRSSANKEVGSEKLPNIFASYANTVCEIQKTGLLASLDPYFTPEEQSEYIDSYIEEGRIGGEGELYIFPIAKCTETFMLNKTDFEPFAEAAGVSAEDLRSEEGVVNTARKYYEWTDSLTPDIPNDGKAFYGRDAMANLFIITSKQKGHEIFCVENGKLTIDVDESVMRYIWDNFYVPYISGYYAASGKYRSDDVKTGNILALVGSTSSAVYFPSEITDGNGTHAVEAEILPLPVCAGGKAVCVQQGAGMAVTKSVPEEEEASVRFLKWFTENENNIAFSAESGYLPVKKEANNYDYYKQTAEKLGIEISGVNAMVIEQAFKSVADYELYAGKAFDGGQAARAVLENNLKTKMDSDRAAVKELLAGGESLEEAVGRFNTDENFKAWYEELKSEIYAAAKAD